MANRGRHYGAQSGAFINKPGGPDASFEEKAQGLGFGRVCGVDEAGRGPLAGPVVAAAVMLPFWRDENGQLAWPTSLDGLNDSKQISEGLRNQLFGTLLDLADVSIASVSAATIDATNIRKASLSAMRMAVLGLPTVPNFALIDGKDEPPGMPCAANTLIKGDGRSLSIAAASVCAKVARDQMMVAADRLYPGYGFAQHKGYGTQQHRDALMRDGPCPIHRRTFAPVRAALMARS